VLAIFCYHLTYLFHIDPEWTERALVSVIAGNDVDDTGLHPVSLTPA